MASSFWGMKLKPKRPGHVTEDTLEGRVLHVTQATLGLHPEIQDGLPERTIVKCKAGDDGQVIFVASLKAGVVESCVLDLYFDSDVSFSITGPTAVHLSGYMEDEDPYDSYDDDDEEDSDYDHDDGFLVDEEDSEEEPTPGSKVTIEELAGSDEEKPKPEPASDDGEPDLKRKPESEPVNEDEDGLPVKQKKPKTSEAPVEAETPGTLSAKKKKKKNKKNKGENEEEESPEATRTEGEKSTGKGKGKTPKKKFPNGLEFETLKMGKPDGKQAKAGKKVMINYIGKLKSGKIFDSTVGKKPFLFRLGVNEVVKGFDIGVEGMRVGDKRRVTIPPSMGYGDKSVGPIPPNSWLFFDIELVDVRR